MQLSLLLTKRGQYSKSQDYSTTCPLLLNGLGLGPTGSSTGQLEQGSDNPCQVEDRMDVRVMEKLPELRLFSSGSGEEMAAIRMPNAAERSPISHSASLLLPTVK